LKAAELKFEAERQAQSGAENSSAAIVSASLAMPKSTSQAVAVAMKDERRTKRSNHIMKDGSDEIHNSGGKRQTQSKPVKLVAKKAVSRTSVSSSDNQWPHLDSSRLFEDGFKEDRRRQSEFHEELLRVRQDVAAAQVRRRKELAKQHLVFKLRAMQTAKHLGHGGLFSDVDGRKSTYVPARGKVHSAVKLINSRNIVSDRSKYEPTTEHSLSINNNKMSIQAENVLRARRRK
jgi:hypothetical protein